MTPYITTVVTPATSRDMTTLADVREQLQFRATDTAQDAWISKVITRCSQQTERYCNRIFVEQSYQDTFGSVWGNPSAPLILGQAPIKTPVVTIDGSALDDTDFIADSDAGMLYRAGANWSSQSSITVAYNAGFTEIPDDVQLAVILLCVMTYRARTRDPLLREKETPNLGREQYWVGHLPGGEQLILPGDIAALLNPYRRGLIG